MPAALPVSLYVSVEVVLSSLQAQAPAVNTNLILAPDPNNVIDVVTREREYFSLPEVELDFGSTSPQYLAASLWFGQNPSPINLFIGRWINVASPGQLVGGGVTALNLLVSTWTAVTSGAFTIFVKGIPYSLTGMNFALVTNLNGVASVIQTALRAATTGFQTVMYDATFNHFVITDGATGVSSVISFAEPPTANGAIVFAVNPTNLDTITINGTIVTFVSGTPTGNQVKIGGSLTITLQSLLTFLGSSSDAGLLLCTYYTSSGTTLYVVAAKAGGGGDYYTIAASAATPSGATLAGAVGVAGGSITFGPNPTAADTITINGISIEFVAGTPTGNQVKIGLSLAATLQALLTFLNASGNLTLILMTYEVSDFALFVQSVLPGVAGNAYTLAASVATPSGGTLSNGAGTDISGMLSLLSTSSGAYQAPGAAAESAVSCVALFDDMFNTQWYGLEVLGATDADHVGVAALIEGWRRRITTGSRRRRPGSSCPATAAISPSC
jgi:hypothetical protein